MSFHRQSPIEMDESVLVDLGSQIGADMLRRILTIANNDFADVGSALAQAQPSDDPVTLRRLVHKLAGLAAQYGFGHLTNYAREIEFEKDASRLRIEAHRLGELALAAGDALVAYERRIA